MRYKRERDLYDHYNNHPEYYSPIDSIDGVREFLNIFDIDYEKPAVVLDIGCGDGRLAKHWPSASVVGVDISPIRIEIANSIPNGTFYCDDIYDFLESHNSTYDLGIAVEVLEHLENPLGVIEMMRSKCDRIIGTLPVNMPYIAHLDVYKDIEDVKTKLSPNKIIQNGEHFYCEWY